MSNEPLFRLALSKEALKYYNKVSINTAAKLDKCFAALESEPVQGSNIKPLKGFAGRYRYRVGNLRVIYTVNFSQKIVFIIAVLPRGQAYKHQN